MRLPLAESVLHDGRDGSRRDPLRPQGTLAGRRSLRLRVDAHRVPDVLGVLTVVRHVDPNPLIGRTMRTPWAADRSKCAGS